ncbi:hypothetical protein [Nitrosomonas supralitoralis]|uniref:Uncharacterized protein n=1 Tax=Nitrosomonas supralitoralis TaxID=2116706 RepID=A0A2P7NSQ4_9PROT|nr:hypothetical protein [Nitrosomonas supralitoralis]PSJ16490.1 hypothetical protein C7H79_13125 [Nitrosomonas supralitoralis]
MKTNQTLIITLAAVLLFALVGCGDHVDGDGKIVLKEPKPEHVDRGIRYSVTHGLVDQDGNPVASGEAE